jgi:hypothetical protein
MFDYFVKERKLNNLIWVYNAGLMPPKGRDVARIEVRKRFYPGDAHPSHRLQTAARHVEGLVCDDRNRTMAICSIYLPRPNSQGTNL